jgi:hypothetical protein
VQLTHVCGALQEAVAIWFEINIMANKIAIPVLSYLLRFAAPPPFPCRISNAEMTTAIRELTSYIKSHFVFFLENFTQLRWTSYNVWVILAHSVSYCPPPTIQSPSSSFEYKRDRCKGQTVPQRHAFQRTGCGEILNKVPFHRELITVSSGRNEKDISCPNWTNVSH